MDGADQFGGRSEKEYRALLETKLQPETLKMTLAFASLFQLVHEAVKAVILDKTKQFYVSGLRDGEWIIDEAAYARDVLVPSRQANTKPSAFRGSVMWLVDQKAISQEEANKLERIYAHRHELTHELATFLTAPDREPDPLLLMDAVTILRRIHSFWIDIELQTGGFYIPESGEWLEDVDANEIQPLSLFLLYQCLQALLPDVVHDGPET